MIKKLFIILGIAAIMFSNSVFAAEEGKVEQKSTPLQGSAVMINIKSDNLKYDRDKDQFVATGNVIIDVPHEKTIIESDQVIYDQASQEIISEKNVKINKHGTIINGDYAKFDLTRDSAIIKNPDANLVKIRIDAQTANIVSSETELLNGKATFQEKDMVFMLSTGAFSSGSVNGLFKVDKNIKPRVKYDIKAKNAIIEQHDYYNILTLKNARISISKFPIATIPVIQATNEKETTRFETMLPEIGSDQEVGMYFGQGYVFFPHKGDTLKVAPLFVVGDKHEGGSGIGIGGMARYMSRTNKTELFYSTLNNHAVLDGKQDLNFISPDTKLQYGSHAYVDNGFFGYQKPGRYIAEIVDNRKLAEAYNYRFILRSSAGFAQDRGNFSTPKFQVQGSMINVEPLLKYKNYLACGIQSDFSMSAYGTGDSYGVARIGPTIASSFGPVNLWAAYYQGGIYGKTPFEYDRYNYGRSNVQFQGSVRLTKYLSLAYLSSLNLTKDNWNKEMVTENSIYAMIGPDELKFKLGYDIERERSLFGLDMLVGSDSSAFKFDRLKVIQK